MHEFFVAIFGDWTLIFYFAVFMLVVAGLIGLANSSKKAALKPLANSNQN